LWRPISSAVTGDSIKRLIENRGIVGRFDEKEFNNSSTQSKSVLSGFVIIWTLTTLNPLVAAHILAEALRDLLMHTITCDNGFEFAQHKWIERLLGCQVYFTDTHSPQQRGANENLYGLLRALFPKGTSLAHVSQYDATKAATTPQPPAAQTPRL
jgi:IS30 family transposase